MAMNKCIKLFLILVFVGAVAFGVTFLPFNLSDKFKAVVEKVSSHLRGLGGMGSDEKVRLDFSKRDSYTHGNLNVVLDKADNVPKDGYLKFIHKGEKDLPLDVEGFTLGDTTLDGVEPGLLDYAAGYFKGESPHLLLVELCLHNKGDGDNGNGEGNKDETKKGETDPKGTEGGKGTGPGDKTEGEKVFYCPGENNKWVKLADGADLGAKVDEVFATLSANTPPTGTPEGGVVPTPSVPATPLPGNSNLDLPKGESPVPAPQNYPLTGPGVTNAAAPAGGQQPGTGAPAGGLPGLGDPVVPGTNGTPGTDGATAPAGPVGTGHGTTPQGPAGTPGNVGTGGNPGNPAAGTAGLGTGAPGTVGNGGTAGTGGRAETGVPTVLGGLAGSAGPGTGGSGPGSNGLGGGPTEGTDAQGGVSPSGQGTVSAGHGLGAGGVGVGGVAGVGVGGASGAGAGTTVPGKGNGATGGELPEVVALPAPAPTTPKPAPVVPGVQPTGSDPARSDGGDGTPGQTNGGNNGQGVVNGGSGGSSGSGSSTG